MSAGQSDEFKCGKVCGDWFCLELPEQRATEISILGHEVTKQSLGLPSERELRRVLEAVARCLASHLEERGFRWDLYLVPRITVHCNGEKLESLDITLLEALGQHSEKGLSDEQESIVIKRLKRTVERVLSESSNIWDLFNIRGRRKIGIWLGRRLVCAEFEADLTYSVKQGDLLYTLYVDVSPSDPDETELLTALLHGLVLYYERRLPVGVIVVSPTKVMYKLLNRADQKRILRFLLNALTSSPP